MPGMMTGAPQQGALSGMTYQPNSVGAIQPGGSGAGGMQGQQLNYGNMVYNANNANQNAMNTFQNNQGFNQNQFNQIYNPYINDVTNNLAAMNQRNFQQQQLPALQSSFGASGQPGSARAMNTISTANNLNNQNTLNQQAQLMNQGYQQAMQNYMGLQQNAIGAGNGMLQAGQTANNMANSQAMLPANFAATMSGALAGIGTQTPSASTTMGGTGTNWAT